MAVKKTDFNVNRDAVTYVRGVQVGEVGEGGKIVDSFYKVNKFYRELWTAIEM